jgi:hypothetical protein
MSIVATFRRCHGDAIRRLALRVGIVGLLLSWFIFPQAALWQHAGAATVSAADWLRHRTVVVLGGTPQTRNAGAELDIDRLSPVNGYPSSEIRCLALAMYHEAGGERPEVQLAVAQAALNRAASFKRPKAICRAIYTGINTVHGCLFESSCRNIGSTPAPGKSLAAIAALAVEIAAGRATAKPAFEKVTHFHASSVVAPPWTRSLHRIGRLGRIDFYTPEAPEAPEVTASAETAAAGTTGSTAANAPQQSRAQRLLAPPRRPSARTQSASGDLAQQAFGQ